MNPTPAIEKVTPDARPPFSVRRTPGSPTHIVTRDGFTIIATVNRDQDGIAEQMAAAPSLMGAIERLLELIYVPDANCSCHVSAPCGDCVQYGGLREAESEARAVIAKAGGAA